MPKVGVVGFGRMGRAILVGLAKGGLQRSELAAYDVDPGALEACRAMGFVAYESPLRLAEEVDVYVIAVKPKDVTKVAEAAAPALRGKAVVSVAAMVSLAELEALFPGAQVFRAMPNVAVEVNSGFIALAPRERRCEGVESLFSTLGTVVWVDEEVLDLLTFFSASTPAAFAELADSLILAALRAGLPHSLAKSAAASVLKGVGRLLEEKGVTEVRDSIITPGGITIRLVEHLYGLEVKSRFLEALVAAFEEYGEMLRQRREARTASK